MRCPQCGQEVDLTAIICPHCSQRLGVGAGNTDTSAHSSSAPLTEAPQSVLSDSAQENAGTSKSISFFGRLVSAARNFGSQNDTRHGKRTIAVTAAAITILVVAIGTILAERNARPITLEGSPENLFSEGLTPVFNDGKWGYIGTSGKIKIDSKYEMALSFSSNGLALVLGNDGESFGYINKSGKYVIGPYRISGIGASSFSDEGIALIPTNGGTSFGYISSDGKWITTPIFETGKPFENGYAAVKAGGKWGYISVTGSAVTDFVYDDAGDFSANGIAAVKQDGLWGYINTDGEMIIDAKYKTAYDFSHGYAAVKEDGVWQYINSTGETVIELPNAADVGDFAPNGLAAVSVNGLWGYIDTTGEFVIEPQFKSAEAFRSCGFASVITENGAGFIDENGKLIVDDKYSSISVYDDGYIVFSEDGISYGVMNTSGRVELKAQYAYISYDKMYEYTNFSRYYSK